MEESKYPLLTKFLNNNESNKENSISNINDKNNKVIKEDFSLKKLNTFNSVLNLLKEEYSYKIKRENAEKN